MKPNVVLFLASDLGYGDLGCYGHPTHRTPHIDRLAARGTRFTDFHSNGALCSPSRAALLTGLYQQRVGVEFVLNHHTRDLPAMKADATTYGHAFRNAGYATGFFGTYHTGYLPTNSPLKLGFDEFWGLCGGMDHHSHVTRWGQPNWWHGETLVDEKGYASDLIANHAIDFITANHDRPFLAHVADFAVHFPWQGPNDGPVFQLGQSYDAPETKYGTRPDRPQAYREMVEAMDANVGRIAACLDRLGLTERTLLVFATDHGGMHLVANNRPLAGAKNSLAEGGHRIPAIACWPGKIAANRVVHDTAMLFDLFPTFAELCGLSVPDRLDGISLWPLLAQDQRLPERTLFWRQGQQKAARRGQWKLLDNRLYDLAADLGETRDCAAEQPTLVTELSQALAQWEAEVPPPPQSLLS